MKPELVHYFSPKRDTVPAVLYRAAELVERGWTQGTFARDSEGLPTQSADIDAVVFCAAGAICCAGDRFTSLGTHSELTLRRHLQSDVPTWNDTPGRTAAEVAAKLREAARGYR
jgi:hypothetical protein